MICLQVFANKQLLSFIWIIDLAGGDTITGTSYSNKKCEKCKCKSTDEDKDEIIEYEEKEKKDDDC